MDTFQPFTWVHLIAVCVCASTWFLAVRGLRAVRGTPRERVVRRWIAWIIAVPCAVGAIAWMWEYGADPSFALPLYLCDLAWMIGCWSLVSYSPLPRDLTYYWGFGLSAQAFVTPTLQEGPANYHFWLFWYQHSAIVLVAIVNVAALRYRASWKGLLRTTILTFLLFCVITPLNLLLDSNYWFTGTTQPDHPTIIDQLGPYPLRLLWMVLLVTALFVLMTVPWELARRSNEEPVEFAEA